MKFNQSHQWHKVTPAKVHPVELLIARGHLLGVPWALYSLVVRLRLAYPAITFPDVAYTSYHTTPRELSLLLAILFNLLTLSPGSPVLPSFPTFPGSPCRSAHWSLSFGLPKPRSWHLSTSQQNKRCSAHAGTDSYLLQSNREDLEVLGFPWDPLCPVGGKQNTRQVAVTEAKGMINGHCYQHATTDLHASGRKKKVSTIMTCGLWRRQHQECMLTFSPGGPGGPTEPGCPSLPWRWRRQIDHTNKGWPWHDQESWWYLWMKMHYFGPKNCLKELTGAPMRPAAPGCPGGPGCPC